MLKAEKHRRALFPGAPPLRSRRRSTNEPEYIGDTVDRESKTTVGGWMRVGASEAERRRSKKQPTIIRPRCYLRGSLVGKRRGRRRWRLRLPSSSSRLLLTAGRRSGSKSFEMTWSISANATSPRHAATSRGCHRQFPLLNITYSRTDGRATVRRRRGKVATTTTFPKTLCPSPPPSTGATIVDVLLPGSILEQCCSILRY